MGATGKDDAPRPSGAGPRDVATFLSTMSHELRAPVSSILVYARLLADNPQGNLSAEEVTYAIGIQRSASDLLRLIDDIADLSRGQASRLTARTEKMSLPALIDHLEEMFHPLAVDRGIGFAVQVADDAPAELYADERRLRQVLRNLLSNAIKFTPQGQVTLRVERSAGEIDFTVEDTGIGIPRESLETIFEAFEQVHGAGGEQHGGLGLGLPVSREIAALLGGRITVRSEPGRGSAFTLRVPVVHPGHGQSAEAEGRVSRERDEAAAAAPEEADGGAQGTGRMIPGKVLIVDGDIGAVLELSRMLGSAGLPVRFALNGQEAVDILRRHPEVSIAFIDTVLPDGHAAIRAVRSERKADLPIIALGAEAAGEREKAMAGGADAYLRKPVTDLDGLLAIAGDLIRRRS